MTRWPTGTMVLRWALAGIREAEKSFCWLKGMKDVQADGCVRDAALAGDHKSYRKQVRHRARRFQACDALADGHHDAALGARWDWRGREELLSAKGHEGHAQADGRATCARCGGGAEPCNERHRSERPLRNAVTVKPSSRRRQEPKSLNDSFTS